MDLCDFNQIKALLSRHGFSFMKSMGQNFLIDPKIPIKIANASGTGPENAVLEIGPGIGSLTSELCRRAGKVTAVELDRRLLPILEETLSGSQNAEIINADILKTDISGLVKERFKGYRPAVCANLPYNITSPVITALIESGCFESMTFMVQREVARRICSAPGTSEYGSFTVFVIII